MMRIGFDIGGTKIAAIALNSDGVCLASRRVKLPPDYPMLLALLQEIASAFESETKQECERIGIGAPAPLNSDGRTVSTRRLPQIDGLPLADALSQKTGKPVTLANDANCFVLSEARDGAAAGCRMVFGAILGTGVGGGLVIDGKIWNGQQSLASEWGHMPLPWPQHSDHMSRKCSWGHAGCIETLLSGQALQDLYTEITGLETDGGTISLLAEREDAEALATINVYADRLARALMMPIFVIDPEIIVLGGSVSTLPGLITRVIEGWSSYNLGGRPLSTRLVLAKHGPDSGVRGAAWL